MHPTLLWTLILALLCAPHAAGAEEKPGLPTSPKAELLMQQAKPRVIQELAEKNLELGLPLFIRVFKLSNELEVWLQKGSTFELFKTYSICSYSGYAGPKLKEGDWQSPEGFYTVSGEQMNPESNFHLSFNIGYPNSFDLSHARTGSAIMVHGNCISQGCFAMGNREIEEIYLLAHHAFLRGQPQFAVHIFPFRMSRINMNKYKDSPWYSFWEELRHGYVVFERDRRVPEVSVQSGRYVVYSPEQEQRLVMINPLDVQENLR
jgi:murein L,D-transpeptidase YafK